MCAAQGIFLGPKEKNFWHLRQKVNFMILNFDQQMAVWGAILNSQSSLFANLGFQIRNMFHFVDHIRDFVLFLELCY